MNFCNQLRDEEKGFFTGKTVNLFADIDTPNMAGIEGHDFTGTFDGHGHTITVSYGSEKNPLTEQYAAPFRYVENGCVIRNLHVEGDIYTSQKYAAGIVGGYRGAGGAITAIGGENGVGIGCDKGGSLTLRFADHGDSLKASSISGTVSVADIFYYTDDASGKYYPGELTEAQKTALGGRTLTSAEAYAVAASARRRRRR